MTIFFRIKRKFIRTFFHEQWSILVCDHEGKILTHIAPPSDRFWADPFPVEYEGKIYIFIEEQIGSGNGTLGYIELYPDLSHSVFIPILQKSYHLSFPNIFCIEQNSQRVWYMIPESHEHGTIDLYRANTFPTQWVYEMTLMDTVTAVDSVVFYHNSKWWLFTSIGSKTCSVNSSISAFYADTFPTNQWIPHPKNPLASGLSNSRMAGAIFLDKKNRCLMRPAQNCLKDYGKETNINEIITLDTLSYQETIVKRILPEKEFHAICTHTINYSDTYMLRDIKTRRCRLLQGFKNKP